MTTSRRDDLAFALEEMGGLVTTDDGQETYALRTVEDLVAADSYSEHVTRGTVLKIVEGSLPGLAREAMLSYEDPETGKTTEYHVVDPRLKDDGALVWVHVVEA